MTNAATDIINKYQGLATKQVISAVQNAAARTGADFSFLMEKASAESSFDPKAKARHSSATGLFQFIESTWLHMVKEYGPKYGLGRLAGKIECEDGKFCVKDAQARREILNLRKNPEISALMAGEFSSDNKQYLEEHLQREAGATELYLAHFLGANGAVNFLEKRDDNGNTVAARAFPKEARANKNVFFDPATGHARTLDEIYDVFDQKFNSGTTPPLHSAAPTLLAENGSTPRAPAQTLPPLAPLDIAQALSLFSDTVGMPSINWNFSAEEKSGFSAVQKISADNLFLLAQARQARA